MVHNTNLILRELIPWSLDPLKLHFCVHDYDKWRTNENNKWCVYEYNDIVCIGVLWGACMRILFGVQLFCVFFFTKSVWNNSEIWIHNQQWKKIPKTDFEYTAKCMEQEQYWLIDSKMTVTECMQYKQQVVMVQTFAFSSYAQANDLECLGLSRGC